jgi:uncharacterized OsmC-like protein
MPQSDIRSYTVRARSTDTFGRVLCSARDQHFVVDGPVQNGCPGEALGPAEIFIAGVATCGVELMQVIAREQQFSPRSIAVEISASMDRSKPVRQDLTVFNAVELQFRIGGVTPDQAADLVERFKRR